MIKHVRAIVVSYDGHIFLFVSWGRQDISVALHEAVVASNIVKFSALVILNA